MIKYRCSILISNVIYWHEMFLSADNRQAVGKAIEIIANNLLKRKKILKHLKNQKIYGGKISFSFSLWRAMPKNHGWTSMNTPQLDAVAKFAAIVLGAKKSFV